MTEVGDQAVALINAGRPDLAERVVRERLSTAPFDADAHRLLADCLRRRGALREALAEADEAVRLTPNSALCHLDRGRVLQGMNRLKDAEIEVRRSLELYPGSPLAWASLAYILVDRGRFAEADTAARAGLASDAHHLDCLTAEALALLGLGRINDAHAAFRAALADDPSRANLHNQLGIALLHRGQRWLAEGEFREALRLNPSLEAARHNLQFVQDWRPQDVYGARVRTWWQGRTTRAKAASVTAAAIGGLAWPGFWGWLVWILPLEAVQRLGPRAGRWARRVYLAVGVAALVGFAVLAAQIADVGRFVPVQARPIGFDPTRPDAVPAYLANLRAARGFQVVTGLLLWLTCYPALVTKGHARDVAVTFAAVAAAIAAIDAILLDVGNMAAFGLFIVLFPRALSSMLLRAELGHQKDAGRPTAWVLPNGQVWQAWDRREAAKSRGR